MQFFDSCVLFGALVFVSMLRSVVHDLKAVQMLMKEWEATVPLFIPNKTATLVPEFQVEDLPLDRITTSIPALAVKDLPLGRTFR